MLVSVDVLSVLTFVPSVLYITPFFT